MPSIKSLRWAFVALAASVGSAHAADLVQWRVEDGGNGHWYGLTVGRGNWDAMEAEAVSRGGHLASIASMSENQFIYSLIPPSVGVPSVPGVWLGLRRAGLPGWAWSDDSDFIFSSWASGEPNNARGNEFWVWMYGPGPYSSGGTGVWNDHPQNDFALPGIVEVVPSPSAVLPLALMALLPRRRRG